MARGKASGLEYQIVFEMTADTRKLKDRIENMQDRGRDVSHVLHWAGRTLQRSYSRNFTTLGAESAASMLKGIWPPLDLKYAAWKMTRYPMAPPMVQTGRLLSLVNNLPRNPSSDVDKTEATFAIDSPIARWHQYGTRNMPARPLVFVPRDFPERFGQKVVNYVSEGKIPRD